MSGWVTLFHPCGAQVTLPLPVIEHLSADERAAAAMMMVTAYLGTGFLVSAPGLEDGETAEEISAVARREAKDETTIIDFYSSNLNLKKKFMHVYLNNEQDLAAFEEAAGLKVDAITAYDGALAIARDDNKAGKYLVSLPRPIKLVWKLSPKWEEWKAAGVEGNEPHKRMLVRYDAGTQAQVVTKSSQTDPTLIIRRYADSSDANPAAYAIYDAYLGQRKIAPLSAEGLKAWYSNPANKALVRLPMAT
jgi:hypothetical protein